MKKHLLLALGITVLFIAVGLSGCNTENIDSRFVGTWDSETTSYFITFNSDGTIGEGLFKDGKWKIKDEKIVITFPIEGNTTQAVADFVFSNNNKNLTLTDVDSGAIMYLIKQ